MVSKEIAQECLQLFSSHYGTWGKAAAKPGRPIVFPEDLFYKLLNTVNCHLTLARGDSGSLIGYSITLRTKVPKYGVISWVTQLVVHENHRKSNVAKRLLHSAFGFSNHFAWGLVSANPYAIRALEKVTRRRCDPMRIAKNRTKLLRVGIENVPYIKSDTEIAVDQSGAKINTKFFQDISLLPSLIENVSTEGKRWVLGDLTDGWEWLAFTFYDQTPMKLSHLEIDEMLKASDSVAFDAYSRMILSPSQKWTRHTDVEVETVIRECGLESKMSVLDFGCGDGRHCIALAQKGLNVIGVDQLWNRIDLAKRQVPECLKECCNFVLADCRSVELGRTFDAAICLYDVIGSFVDIKGNRRILENLYRHLNAGGKCVCCP